MNEIHLTPEERKADLEAGKLLEKDGITMEAEQKVYKTRPSDTELNALREKHPDFIFTNEDYDRIKAHELVKANLGDPDFFENAKDNDKIDEYLRKTGELEHSIWIRRYNGDAICHFEELPRWTQAMCQA